MALAPRHCQRYDRVRLSYVIHYDDDGDDCDDDDDDDDDDDGGDDDGDDDYGDTLKYFKRAVRVSTSLESGGRSGLKMATIQLS